MKLILIRITKLIPTFIFAICAIACVCAIYKFIAIYSEATGSFLPNTCKRDEWASVGDYFGGIINPILSFASVVLLIVTLWQNQKELELTRSELHSSATSQAEQSRTQYIQRFENTFFSLLGQFQILLNTATSPGTYYNSDGHAIKLDSESKQCLYEIFGNPHYFNVTDEFPTTLESAKNSIRASQNVNQLFRVTYQILKLVNNTHFNDDENEDYQAKKVYTNILRSFITDEVITLLAINASSIDSSDSYHSYKLLIEKFSFLEHMPFSTKANINQSMYTQIAQGYNVIAFGDNINRDRYLQSLGE